MEESAIPNRKFWAAAIALGGAFLLVRFWVAFSFWPSHLDPCERYGGMMGKEFLKGPILSMFEYQTDVVEGASIIVGMLTSVAFILVGYSYAALKLVAFVCSFTALLLWAILVSRIFGRRAGLWYIAVAVLLPPGLLYWSLWLCAKWVFADIIHAVVLLLLIGLINVKCATNIPFNEWKSFVLVLTILGIILGFGIYLSVYFYIIAAYAFFVLTFYRIPNSARRIVALLTGFLMGLAPWIAYNLIYGFNSLKVFGWGSPVGKSYFSTAHSVPEWVMSSSVRFIGRIISMIFHWWTNSWLGPFAPPGLLSGMLGCTYEFLVLVGLASFIFSIRRSSNREIARARSPVPLFPDLVRRNGGIVFGFFVFCILVTCFSNIGIVRADCYPYRYLMPLMPFYLLSLAICFDRLSLCRIKAMRYAAWSAATILFALLLLGNLPFFENWDPGASLRTEGYDYGYLGARMGHGVYSQGGLNNALALAEKVRDRQDRDDLIGYITDMCWYIPIADRPEANLVAGGGQIAIGDVATFKAFADGNVEKGYRPILYRGLGRGLSWSHGSQFEKIGELAGVLDNGSARWAWQGVGDIEASRHGATVDWVTGTLEHLPESARGPFCEGVGARWRLDAVDRGDDLVRRMETLPEEVRAHCLAGRDLGVIRQPFSLLEW